MIEEEWINISELIKKYKNNNWTVIPLIIEKGKVFNMRERKELLETTLQNMSKIACRLCKLNINATLITASPVFTRWKYKIRVDRSGRNVKAKVLWIKRYEEVDFPLVYCLAIPRQLITCCFEIYCILIKELKQLNC